LSDSSVLIADLSDLEYARFSGSFARGVVLEAPFDAVTLINGLHGRILVARILAAFHLDQLHQCGVPDDSPIALGDAYEIWTKANPEAPGGVETVAMRLEREATAIAFRHVQDRGEDLIYVNDLARQKTGIDLMTRRPDGVLVITEIKGRTGRGGTSPVGMMAMTRHKGRQLSHRWIWSSLCEAGLFSGSASLFLNTLEEAAERRYRRRAIVIDPSEGTVLGIAEEDEFAADASFEEAGEQVLARQEVVELRTAGIGIGPFS
jgi:hypothetical protein